MSSGSILREGPGPQIRNPFNLEKVSSRNLLAISVICFFTLVLEITFTRLFSATSVYHFTFVVVALTLLGLGGSGAVLYLIQDKLNERNLQKTLAASCALAAITSLVALQAILANPLLLAYQSGGHRLRVEVLPLVLLSCILPFFFSGFAVSVALYGFRAQISAVYAADLLGAAFAVLASPFLLRQLGAINLVLFCTGLAVLAATLFAPTTKYLKLGFPVVGLLFLIQWQSQPFHIRDTKESLTESVVFEKWNEISRVTVHQTSPDNYDIKIDGAASTGVVAVENFAHPYWGEDVSAVGYYGLESAPERVLVLGPGGGIDVVRALHFGAKKITGVELNSTIAIDVMQGSFLKHSRGLYLRPEVEIVVDEGRSYVSRSDQRFDILQLSLIDTWSAGVSGAFSLTENALYTLEGFEAFLERLNDGGFLSITRFDRTNGPEGLRLLSLGSAALKQLGLSTAEVRNHLFFIAGPDKRVTLLLSKTPIATKALAQLNQVCENSGFEVLLSPTAGSPELVRLVETGDPGVLISKGETLEPPTDDRPFFFFFLSPQGFWESFLVSGTDIANPTVTVFAALGVCLVALCLGFIALPLTLKGRSQFSAIPRNLRMWIFFYFALLGLAFITVELALIARLSIFLGHPLYSFVVVLFAVLLGGAVGARLSEKVQVPRPMIRRSTVTICIATLGSALILGPLLTNFAAWPLLARILVAGGLCFFIGTLMGLPLPLGLRMINEDAPILIPWAWGINGIFSVVGTLVATLLSLLWGLQATLLLGALAYLAAGLLAPRQMPRA